ncbi:MAG: acetyl-CoA carboxylase, carboxyltransferase subunit beta [Bacteroidales bacterium]
MSAKLPSLLAKLFAKKGPEQKASVPENLFMQCPDCKNMIYRKKIVSNLSVCPDCSHHFRIPNSEWIKILFDDKSVQGLFGEYQTMDILDFPGYKEKIEKAYSNNLNEGIDTFKARLDGIPVLAGIMNAEFMMGSMGSVVGERITKLFEKAASQNLPVIILTRSGGARMQEGAISLMQMAKVSAAIKQFGKTGNLYITVLTNPTTGGVSASFAMLGDVIIAEPKALIGFAGPRVIEQTIKQKLPEGFQSAEFLQDKGFTDLICERKDLRNTLKNLLKIHHY